MDATLLKAWGPILKDMAADSDLAERAWAENEWFTPYMLHSAIHAMLPWFEGNVLGELRLRYPVVTHPQRIGLILAGNLPLVGLHDVLMVLLSGHHAVVKPSHKDRVLLQYLVVHSPAALQASISLVDAILPSEIDFLVATGSNVTARQIDAAYAATPKLIRQNRFSIAVVDYTTSSEDFAQLAEDILLYHGMGCRSVSSVLVPADYDLAVLVEHLDRFAADAFAPCWHDVLRYAQATQIVVGQAEQPCKAIVLEKSKSLQPSKIGILNIIEYASETELQDLLDSVRPDLQCIVGDRQVTFGQAQHPTLDDFADGVDTMELLCNV